jgi:hypothetical protein
MGEKVNKEDPENHGVADALESSKGNGARMVDSRVIVSKSGLSGGWFFFAWVAILSPGLGGCLKNNKIMRPASSQVSSTDPRVLACAQASVSQPDYVFYPTMASCQATWSSGCGPTTVLYSGRAYVCARRLAGGGSATTNTGTVSTNTGTVSTNTGTVSTNTGTVSTNTGTVNTNTGTMNTNTGTMNTDTGGWYTTGCFIAGTLIEMEDGSFKSIERIRVGDRVRGVMGKVNRVEKLFVIPHRGLKYSFNGSKYFVSASHPFLTEQGWKSLDPMVSVRENPGLKVTQLSEGDVVLSRQGSVRLHSIRAVENSEMVFNFRTDGNHSYIADGFKVHNAQNKTTTNSTGWYPETTGLGFE